MPFGGRIILHIHNTHTHIYTHTDTNRERTLIFHFKILAMVQRHKHTDTKLTGSYKRPDSHPRLTYIFIKIIFLADGANRNNLLNIRAEASSPVFGKETLQMSLPWRVVSWSLWTAFRERGREETKGLSGVSKVHMSGGNIQPISS